MTSSSVVRHARDSAMAWLWYREKEIKAYIVRRDLFWMTNIDTRDQNKERPAALWQQLNRIEDLQSTIIVNSLSTRFTALASSASGEIDETGVRALEELGERRRWRVLEGEHLGLGTGRGDVGCLGLVADDGDDAVFLRAEDLGETKCDLRVESERQ